MAATLRTILNCNKQVVKCISKRTISSDRDSNILKSPITKVVIPNISIPELISTKCDKYEDYIASVCPITVRNYTYSQLWAHSENLAGFLRKKLMLNKGDTVGILMPNYPEYAIACLGILRGGLVGTFLNPIYTPDEISRQLLDSGARALITVTDLCQKASTAIDTTRTSVHMITAKVSKDQTTPQGAIDLGEIIQEKMDLYDIPFPEPEDIAFIPYSSGTTGLPKGVELTHSSIVANLYQTKAPEVDFMLEATEYHQDVIPAILPQFHIYGLASNLLSPLLKGAKQICLPRFEPKLFIDVLVNYKPDLLVVAPQLVSFITAQTSVKPEYLEKVRNVISGSSLLPSKDIDRFKAKLNREITVNQGYGMTEASPVIAVTLKDGSSTEGSTGPPLPNTEIKVVDYANATLPTLGPYDYGELWIRGPQVMKGYHKRPKETRETIVDGWLRTGDIGFYDEFGNLKITDRLKELIKVKGFQVPPAELEEIIREYPGVEEVGVIGIPHERYGQVPRAYVTTRDGADVDKIRLEQFVKVKVAEYKKLRGGVCVIDTIPKNSSGKILRKDLMKIYMNETQHI